LPIRQEALQTAIDKSSLKNPTVIVEGETGEKPVMGLASIFELEAQSIAEIPPQAHLSLENNDGGLVAVDMPEKVEPKAEGRLSIVE
jgi:hypothetical protein